MTSQADQHARSYGVPVTTTTTAWVGELREALGPDSVGSVVDVTIRRGGEPVRIKLTIGERADA